MRTTHYDFIGHAGRNAGQTERRNTDVIWQDGTPYLIESGAILGGSRSYIAVRELMSLDDIAERRGIRLDSARRWVKREGLRVLRVSDGRAWYCGDQVEAACSGWPYRGAKSKSRGKR